MLQLPLSRARPCSHAAGSRRQSAAVQSTTDSAHRIAPGSARRIPCVMHRSCGRPCNAAVALQCMRCMRAVGPQSVCLDAFRSKEPFWLRSSESTGCHRSRAMRVRCPTAACGRTTGGSATIVCADEGRAEDARALRASPWLGRSRGAPPPCETAPEYCARRPWRH